MDFSESDIVQMHVPCPDCGSHDAMTIYTNGTYCFSCKKAHKGTYEKVEKKPLAAGLLTGWDYGDLPARHITEATCRRYSYGKAAYKDNPVQIANYMDDEGNILFQKIRGKDKKFSVKGTYVPRFYGQHLFSGGRKLVVTEGEIDCLTVSQVQGNKYPVVSIPNGVGSARAAFKANLDWLSRFDEVIVMFDSDEPGKKAVESVSGLLPPKKLKVATLPLKDPNDCLKAGHPDDIVKAIWNAAEYHPDGILNAADCEDLLLSTDADIVNYTLPWADGLTKMTSGLRKGEMLLLTAGSGIGKSTLAREIAYHLKMKCGLKVGLVMLEEAPKKTLRDIMSIHLKRPLHLMWNDKTKKAVAKSFPEVFGDGRFILYDHFGAIEGGRLLDKIRYLITCEDCDFVIFDHISIAVTAMDDATSDERKTIDRLITALRSLIEETGAGIIIVSHLRKTDLKGTPFETGGTISLDDLRGSGSLKQIPDTVLALERNQQADDEDLKNLLKLRVLKCRFTGDTGIADYVRFNKKTNRIEPVDPLEIKATANKGDEPF